MRQPCGPCSRHGKLPGSQWPQLRLRPREPKHGQVDPAVGGGWRRWWWGGVGDGGASVKTRQVLDCERSALARWGLCTAWHPWIPAARKEACGQSSRMYSKTRTADLSDSRDGLCLSPKSSLSNNYTVHRARGRPTSISMSTSLQRARPRRGEVNTRQLRGPPRVRKANINIHMHVGFSGPGHAMGKWAGAGPAAPSSDRRGTGLVTWGLPRVSAVARTFLEAEESRDFSLCLDFVLFWGKGELWLVTVERLPGLCGFGN